jgi:hypothetical protein
MVGTVADVEQHLPPLVGHYLMPQVPGTSCRVFTAQRPVRRAGHTVAMLATKAPVSTTRDPEPESAVQSATLAFGAAAT